MEGQFKEEFEQLLKKHNITTFYFYGATDDDSKQFENWNISNLRMLQIISGIIYHYKEFEYVKDVVISDALRYMDPLRVSGTTDDDDNFRSTPFVPMVFFEDEDSNYVCDDCKDKLN